jgi:hypothetical protein
MFYYALAAGRHVNKDVIVVSLAVLNQGEQSVFLCFFTCGETMYGRLMQCIGQSGKGTYLLHMPTRR